MIRRRVGALTISGLLALSLLGVTATNVLATCQQEHLTTYVNANSGGTGFLWCFDFTNGQPNLNNVPGPCPQFMHADSWNDCVSSVEVSLGATQCYALYRDANYTTLMVKYWGALGPDTKFNLAQDNQLTSFKKYSKTPTTPAGNC